MNFLEENGIVYIDSNKCVGCCYCEWSCPYSAPQFDASQGIMTKCDFCRDELQKEQQPVCVAACPTRALLFGDYDELLEIHGETMPFAPLPSLDITSPRLIILPSRQAESVSTSTGLIQNPEEVKDA
jgi:anaerobic dimethyl sulfoxide reductase subunit B (iron-sulfur subunit)